MNPFTEDNLVEKTVIDLVKKLWGDESCHINAYTDTEDAKLGREHRGEVVLKKRAMTALQRLNPDKPLAALETAYAELVRDRSQMTPVNANHEVHKLLLGGVGVDVRDSEDREQIEEVRFFDFDTIENNEFLCVSQMWITGEHHTRRPDVILFVNGIPLLLLELKASHKNIVDAYKDNIRDYKDTIPQLFWFNLGIIISNGIDSRFGSFTSPFEYFNEWKKVDNEENESKTNLPTIISGICERGRMLDIFENFVLFDESSGEKRKVVPRYFQYYGVNRAFDNVRRREELDGKLGVFWHTQGSGKSYSMVFLSQKVLRKLEGNFTFVVVTDRGDLDRAAYKNFATVGAIYETEVHATSIANLKELLSEDHRQIFTTIQKFQDIDEPVSNRGDIIVMTDEAHRTQYDRLAQNMRKALPGASFIGFTGTPLLADGEERTRETFGNYVSVYNFGQSIEDKATVPLYYENRVPKLENVNDELEGEITQVMDFYELNEEQEEKLEQEFSTFYHIVTREDRLNAIARDIVQHFVSRGYDGKAMVVSIDKKTAVRMYTKVKAEWERYIAKLRIDLSRATDEYERDKILSQLERHENVDMAVVFSQGQNEVADLKEYDIDVIPLRERMNNEDLEEEFKKTDSNLRIVFVCAMWLTGFDVKNLSTLYLDKPLKNHTLMQTIARANRVYPGKTNGMIVDYIGVFKNIERALALYANTGAGDPDDIIREKHELLNELKRQLKATYDFLEEIEIDIPKLLEVQNQDKLLLIESYANKIVSDQQKKKKYLNLSSDTYNSYKSLLPDPEAENYYAEVIAIKVIASRVREVSLESIDVSQVKKDLEALLDKSIQAGNYVVPHYKKMKDLSALDADALHRFFAEIENKNIQVEKLKTELTDKIEEMVRKNRTRERFIKRLSKLLDMYNSGAHDIEHIFEGMIELAKSLDEEEQRAVKENLSEDELAIFDLLLKDDLNPSEVERIKGVAKYLWAKLKTEKLVLDWREKESTRAGVKSTIFDVLYNELPEPTYEESDCEEKGITVYNFVYDTYV